MESFFSSSEELKLHFNNDIQIYNSYLKESLSKFGFRLIQNNSPIDFNTKIDKKEIFVYDQYEEPNISYSLILEYF